MKYYITTEHHNSTDLSTCQVYNLTTYQWVSLPRALNISPMSAERANDLAVILQDSERIECYVTSSHNLVLMIASLSN